MRMATLPPRNNPTPTRISKQHLSPLQTLLQMGFPKHRAEKALASTGNRDVQLASDWLLAHVNDPSLDEFTPREFILYACPTGSFLHQLEDLWAKSKEICGWNGAHNYVPHITLVSFFKAPDESALQISKSLKQVVDLAGAVLNRPLKLELYTSPNFMGFFVAEDDANFLKRLALQYVKEVSNSTISLEPHVKSLHLTLAYQFLPNQFNALKNLAENLDPSAASNWELRLYSRDPRLATKHVHKVLFPHTPREPDELELRIGDFIYLSSEALENSSDGWVEGVSWLTGSSGHLPQNYTERTAESDAWTMHSVVPLNVVSNDIDAADGVDSTKPKGSASVRFVGIESSDDSVLSETQGNSDSKAPTERYSAGASITSVEEDVDNDENRKIYIMRHGERVDFTFGPWTPYCFDEFGHYIRKDLNMPKNLPKRQKSPNCWQVDSPLTNVGLYQAKLTGEALRDSGAVIDHVYCSPSYRCIQTCDSALEGLNLKNQLSINVEPGLFEWMAWYPDGVPDWCTKDELTDAKYKIFKDYTPIVSETDLKNYASESSEEFYNRNHNVLVQLLKVTTGNIFIVAHAATLDTCTRQLMGREPRATQELRQTIHKIPYCSIIGIEKKNNEWVLMNSTCLPCTHSKNSRFENNVLHSA